MIETIIGVAIGVILGIPIGFLLIGVIAVVFEIVRFSMMGRF